jgi:hypothetical protein
MITSPQKHFNNKLKPYFRGCRFQSKEEQFLTFIKVVQGSMQFEMGNQMNKGKCGKSGKTPRL